MTESEPVSSRPAIANRWLEKLAQLCPELAARLLAWDGAGASTVSAWIKEVGVPPEAQVRALAQVLDVPYLESLGGRAPSADFLEKIPIGLARQHRFLGLAAEGETLPVAISSLECWPLLDVVSRYLKRPVEPLFAPASQILASINACYQERTGQAQVLIDALDQRDVLTQIAQLEGREDLLDVAGRAPVIKLVNLVLFEAVKGRASDVHLQPYEDRLVVRMRIDGVLFDAFDAPKDLQEEVLSRIKVLGRMNIAEKRLPQDGRATVQVGDRLIDLRISSLPTSYGERIVIRLLDKSAQLYTLGELGMTSETMRSFRELIRLEHGLILVTGPTGSGKSTTLYAALQEINAKDRNVVTLEDPIEYQLEGISQTQVSSKKGMTFASGLRTVLRQDPDIIMVGEIRDQETAVMAIQSALTGHLVFSTLHTNDAPSAVTRLLDLGIEPYLVSSSLVAVLAQRLVREICPECATLIPSAADDLRRLGVDASSGDWSALRHGAGCAACRQTGYQGRIGLFELLVVNDPIRSQIQVQANATQIRETAATHGMHLLRDDGLEKILAGRTTIDEVVRVTMRSTL